MGAKNIPANPKDLSGDKGAPKEPLKGNPCINNIKTIMKSMVLSHSLLHSIKFHAIISFFSIVTVQSSHPFQAPNIQ